ncbi:amidase [Sphingomonas pokkalii]|uniref:Amidase n=1 Tax=Sphingomonas pokkalii TaxID=2175090 RepID=A0A2U0SH62_9SPHN|nr:amidase [Sphingomonas pokkalii]PVX30693.1 amidase [Sphingomonas pokkalii]
MTDWHRIDSAALRAAYAAGRTDPQAVLANHLARIERIDPALRSFVALHRAGALTAAAESAARWRNGTARALEGVPVAVKVNLAVAGLEWNAGMGARRGILADRDAAAVALLRDAGAIVLGTLNMHEAALGATSDNPFFGRVANPHAPDRTPGGSSGGSGAAVAAGLCTAALGTDTMGSVRIPAAYAGIYGLKPSNGEVPEDGLVPLSRALDTIGPLARSIRDLAVVLDVLAPALGQGENPARLLVPEAALIDACEPAIAIAHARARTALGLPAETLVLPDGPASVQAAGFVRVARELAAYLGDTPRDRLSPELRFLLDHAARADAERSAAVLARTRAALLAAIGEDGVLLTPATPQVAFAHTNRPPANQAMFTALANVADLPALVVPAGTDADGMPVAVQLIGAPGADRALLRLARRIDIGFVPSPILLS